MSRRTINRAMCSVQRCLVSCLGPGLLVLALGRLHAAAPQTGPERWRSLAHLPMVSLECKFEFMTSRGVVLLGDQYGWLGEIKALEQDLKASPDDPDKLFRLARLYHWTGAGAQSTQAADQAIRLWRRRLAAQTQQGAIHTQLGQALALRGQFGEAEAALRRGTTLAAEDWASWLALGEFLAGRALHALVPGTNGPDSGAALVRALLEAEQPRRPSAEQVIEARRLMTEAERCLDRAVALGGRRSEPYFARACARGHRRLIEFAATWDGNREQAALVLSTFGFTPEALADFRQAARHSPKDPRLVGGLALLEAYTAVAQAGQRRLEDTAEEDWWRRLPETNQVSIRSVVQQLEALGEDPDPKIAGSAWEMLAGVRFCVFRDVNGVETAARRAVALDPTREQAWELLTLSQVLKEAWEELRRVGEARLKHRRNARNHVLLAKALEKLQLWPQAEQQVDAALALAPEDPIPHLCKAVLLLKRGTDEALAQAGQRLKKAQALTAAAPGPQTSRSLVLNLALYAALRGEFAEARQLVELVLKSQPNDDEAEEILQSLPR